MKHQSIRRPLITSSAVRSISPHDVVIGKPPPSCDHERHVLGRFSVRGKSEELARKAGDVVHVLQGIALKGQGTVIYAAPNTGKSLLTLAFLCDSISARRIRSSHVIYVNLDDNLIGLAQKAKIAEEYEFEMLADGHQEFAADNLLKMLPALIKGDQAKDTILIVDTAKKLADLMDKKRTTDFTKQARTFILAGGTIIALAHTNKNKAANGKSVQGGTSDLVDDFDCAFIIDELSTDVDKAEKVVEFRNIKRRGDVALTAGFTYSIENNQTYEDLLLSVRPVDLTVLETIRHALAQQTDAVIIDALKAAIAGGTRTKMELGKKVAGELKISGRSVLRIIDRYTGDDPTQYHWNYVVRDRGKHEFSLLGGPPKPAAAAP
jgi:hypothetical protein